MGVGVWSSLSLFLCVPVCVAAEYIVPALVLGQTLNMYSNKTKFAFVTPNISLAQRTLLKEVGFITKDVTWQPGYYVVSCPNSYLDVQFLRLNCWHFSNYDSLVYVDADVVSTTCIHHHNKNPSNLCGCVCERGWVYE